MKVKLIGLNGLLQSKVIDSFTDDPVRYIYLPFSKRISVLEENLKADTPSGLELVFEWDSKEMIRGKIVYIYKLVDIV